MEGFDFIDLGAKTGKMEKYAQDLFGAKTDIVNEVFDACKNNNHSLLERLLSENEINVWYAFQK